MIVACVLRSGGDYTAEYVRRLRDNVAAHLHGHRFVCLSDVPVPCERVPLLHDWPGWWSKLEVFRLVGPVLYLDLDTVVLDDLSVLAAPDADVVMLRDFYAPEQPASGVMFWRHDLAEVYEAFAADPEQHMERCSRRPLWGDGGFIGDYLGDRAAFWQDLLPDAIASRKRHSLPERRRATVVCYHGQPRPHETGWAA